VSLHFPLLFLSRKKKEQEKTPDAINKAGETDKLFQVLSMGFKRVSFYRFLREAK
jgi:hypothetical protein